MNVTVAVDPASTSFAAPATCPIRAPEASKMVICSRPDRDLLSVL
jgi:hypothetical protein